MIRQGDILLRPIHPTTDDVSEWSLGDPVSRLVLAEGEATGHAHVIEGSVLAATAGGRALLHILHGTITHPEHDPVPRSVPPGWYEIIRQRVYTPTAPAWVRD